MNFSASGVIILLSFVGSVSPAAAQLRQIEVEPPSGYCDPILIQQVTVGGSNVNARLMTDGSNGRVFGPLKPFSRGDDWLQEVDFRLFNRTNKTIVGGRLILTFSELGSPLGIPGKKSVFLDFGRIPAVDAYFGDGKPIPQDPNISAVAWAPGTEYVLHVGAYRDVIRRQLGDSTLSQVFVIKNHFFFEDGMRWTGGAYAMPDRERPGHWVAEEVGFFPGTREQNWPIPGHTWGRTHQ